MDICAIVGVNWGDEGKGRMVDYLAEQYDVIVRYQGGNNAGHTIVNEYGKFALNLLPSGIFRRDKLNLLGVGTIIDLQHLCAEIERVRARGVEITPDNFRISDRAMIVMPFHPLQDQLEEERLGGESFGSTRRGIAPAYGDKAMKKGVQMGDLLHPDALKNHVSKLVDWKNAVFSAAYGQKSIRLDETMDWLEQFGKPLLAHVCDAGMLLKQARASGKRVLFEAQLGALRDLDYGIYPYTSSSSPLAAYAPIGGGLPLLSPNRVVGVVKAYSTCVGEGPFVGELTGAEGDTLREAGGEYGAATGRPRRVAHLDIVATRRGVELQNATELALTKLDILSGRGVLPVCTAYRLRGGRIENFPFTPELEHCEPIYETLPGWDEDISGARTFDDLPVNAKAYVLRAEQWLNCPIRYVSVGPERDQIILR